MMVAMKWMAALCVMAVASSFAQSEPVRSDSESPGRTTAAAEEKDGPSELLPRVDELPTNAVTDRTTAAVPRQRGERDAVRTRQAHWARRSSRYHRSYAHASLSWRVGRHHRTHHSSERYSFTRPVRPRRRALAHRHRHRHFVSAPYYDAPVIYYGPFEPYAVPAYFEPF
ncbi:MAG: hypothetical protein JO069_10460 [Verrucomicrobia bacterium]|nr:hypothetical protein [Verrucomicrobiota bacterium]